MTMFSNITVYTDHPLLSVDDIEITVDDQFVQSSIDRGIININLHDAQGLHLLKIKSKRAIQFKITNVSIENSKLRKFIYLSWLIDSNNHIIQPCTDVWDKNQCWTLPFALPLSYWVELVERKIPNSDYGKNLFDKYHIWFPESLTLDSVYPQIIQDFFKYNFNFSITPKVQPNLIDIPYLQFNKKIDPQLINDIHNEILVNKDFISQNASPYSQLKENQEEYNTGDSNWEILWLRHLSKSNPRMYETELPATWKLIDLLNLDFIYGFIGVLPPKQFIYPHCDDLYRSADQYENIQGCTGLYIPIHWPTGNWIKFAGGGIPNLQKGPCVINNDYFTHSVVNDSDENRYVLVLRTTQEIIKDCILV